jgi:hemolysin activation/secretion protein
MQIKKLINRSITFTVLLLPPAFAADSLLAREREIHGQPAREQHLSKQQLHEQQPRAQHLHEQQLREQQQLSELQERPDVFLPNAKTVTPKKSERTPTGPCFTIKQIVLEGAPQDWLPWLQQPPPILLPQCMYAQDIKTVFHILANRFLVKGFITSDMELPAQNLQKGVLRFTVWPNYVGKIRNKDGSSDRALHTAFPMQAGDIIHIRDLEQGVEQLGRPLTQQARIEITPGEVFGTSDIVVIRENQYPLSVGLSWDNSGLDVTGRRQIGGYLVWDNPLKLNDMFILSTNQDNRRLQQPGSRSQALAYVLPWGNWTWGINLGQYRYKQTFMIEHEPLTSSGSIKHKSISAERLLHRTQFSKTELSTQLIQKVQRSYIDDIELLIHHRRLSIVSLGINHRHYIGTSVLEAQVGVQRGTGWFNAEPVPDGAPDWYPNARAQVYTSKLSLHIPFKIARTAWRWSSEWRGQYSPHTLFGSEQLMLGSRYTVRGFQQGIAGNSGHYWRNDLAWSMVQPNPKGRMFNFYMGIDVGRLTKPLYPLETQTLAGWVVGIRGALSKYAHAELSVAHPIHMPVEVPRKRVVYFKVAFHR